LFWLQNSINLNFLHCSNKLIIELSPKDVVPSYISVRNTQIENNICT